MPFPRRSFFALLALLSAAGTLPAHADYTLTVNKNENRGTWEGWGCSLAWWGKGVGGSAYQNAYADLIFTLNTVSFRGESLPGLGMNLARYNIGGGGLPTDNIGGTVENRPSALPWYKDIDGYWKDWSNPSPTSASWDWFRDSNQRNLMWAARDRGAKFEFFANAPMWWMTTEKSSAGGALQSWNRRDFARYLANVVQYAQTNWGVSVSSLEPFNEPSAGWWTYPQGQEGCNLSQAVQKEILGYLREELNARGLSGLTIAGSDENTMTQALSTYNYFKGQNVSVSGVSTNVASLLGKVNVHSYSGLAPWRDNVARQNLKTSVGSKRLWVSEYGDDEGGGMTLAQTITEDLTYLKPTAWVYWQPVEPYSAWGLVNGAYGNPADETAATRAQPAWTYYKYYVFAQFSRFLRPGYKIIGNNDHNSVAAYDSATKKLVLISVNYGNAQKIVYDLTSLTSITGTSAAVTATNTNGSKLLFASSVPVSTKKFTINAEANTIYSTVVTGVTL